ncbi:hypothetical protein [Streptomyces sp. AP-93]|uniref:hypothetical protein n=1 Tax=Streptomyces sp. AP-93 TaxID=2929048 RepID=UPI001FAFCA9B|nr:hypothetical protein [Streptomyces sp. AP-93]MCJ0868944.1 hypothetical protein [Streptomyces sp. AP-93]
MTSNSDENKALTLLTAIVAGDADIQDGVAELKNEGIVSTGDLLSALSEGLRLLETDEENVGQPLSLELTRRETPRELVSAIVQRIPEVPFVLNGTVYDPEDITRFNGKELHFVASPEGDHMLVLDDRELFASWRQLTFLEQYRHGRCLPPITEPLSSSLFARAAPPFPQTGFNEHINFEGDWKNLRKNRGFRKLGSWNDEISSFKMVGTRVTELYEHNDYLGETFTRVLAWEGDAYFEERNLHNYGWGDRASSVGTW